jgi:hypothetical protein
VSGALDGIQRWDFFGETGVNEPWKPVVAKAEQGRYVLYTDAERAISEAVDEATFPLLARLAYVEPLVRQQDDEREQAIRDCIAALACEADDGLILLSDATATLRALLTEGGE